jgi:hypothetical protein
MGKMGVFQFFFFPLQILLPDVPILFLSQSLPRPAGAPGELSHRFVMHTSDIYLPYLQIVSQCTMGTELLHPLLPLSMLLP